LQVPPPQDQGESIYKSVKEPGKRAEKRGLREGKNRRRYSWGETTDIDESAVIKMKTCPGPITDLRREWGNLRRKLPDILVIALTTVIIGGDGYDDMEDFGSEREEWFRGFLELPNGIPDKDAFRRVVRTDKAGGIV
jgi:hypothetical protein